MASNAYTGVISMHAEVLASALDHTSSMVDVSEQLEVEWPRPVPRMAISWDLHSLGFYP